MQFSLCIINKKLLISLALRSEKHVPTNILSCNLAKQAENMRILFLCSVALNDKDYVA